MTPEAAMQFHEIDHALDAAGVPHVALHVELLLMKTLK